MAARRLICGSGELAAGGQGVRFALPGPAGAAGGFAVRHGGAVRAFVNRCPHLGTELDWQPGEFFEEAGVYLICSTHGALFEPSTGYCVAGPCRGASLQAIRAEEREGQIFIDEASRVRSAPEPSEKP
jgi:nitrite reductase/ring-hydroxylating ferredoxin subunit